VSHVHVISCQAAFFFQRLHVKQHETQGTADCLLPLPLHVSIAVAAAADVGAPSKGLPQRPQANQQLHHPAASSTAAPDTSTRR
jgi:hypothetical protein